MAHGDVDFDPVFSKRKTHTSLVFVVFQGTVMCAHAYNVSQITLKCHQRRPPPACKAVGTLHCMSIYHFII